jgi:hypothetical protein
MIFKLVNEVKQWAAKMTVRRDLHDIHTALHLLAHITDIQELHRTSGHCCIPPSPKAGQQPCITTNKGSTSSWMSPPTFG